MSRAQRKYWEGVAARRGAEEQADAAERLAIRALLDRRIPESELLVRDMKHPAFLGELSAGGSGPTGAGYSAELVRRYAAIIAKHAGGGAQAVHQHLTRLAGRELAGKLGVNVARLKVADQPAPGGGATVSIRLGDREAIALAGYLASPGGLNLGNLPLNPFGAPRVADLMDRMKWLRDMAMITPTKPPGAVHPQVGLTVHELLRQVGKCATMVLNEISRAMPSNEAREAALTAMRLEGIVKIYTPHVVTQAGWQVIRAFEADPATGRPALPARRVPVYDAFPQAATSPTRYRACDLRSVDGPLQSLYGG